MGDHGSPSVGAGVRGREDFFLSLSAALSLAASRVNEWRKHRRCLVGPERSLAGAAVGSRRIGHFARARRSVYPISSPTNYTALSVFPPCPPGVCGGTPLALDLEPSVRLLGPPACRATEKTRSTWPGAHSFRPHPPGGSWIGVKHGAHARARFGSRHHGRNYPTPLH